MKITFSPAQTRSLANALQIGHGLQDVPGHMDDGPPSSEPGGPSNHDPIRALVVELLAHADDGAVLVVQRDGAKGHGTARREGGGFFDAVARLVAGDYGRDQFGKTGLR